MGYFSGFSATPTKLKTFLDCPRKYFFYYINGETRYKQPERAYFTLGHHIHGALRDFFEFLPADRSPEALLELLDKNWATHRGKEAGFATDEEENLNKERAIKMLRNFFEWENWQTRPYYLPRKEDKIPGYHSARIEPLLTLGGAVDRIDEEPDGSLHVIDYKTGKGDDPDELQLPIYAIVVSRAHNRAVSKMSYLMLEHGKRYTENITIEGNMATVRRVKEIIAKIPTSTRMEDYVCPTGDNCRHCNYLLELGFDPKTGKKIGGDGGGTQEEQLFSSDLPF